MTPPDLGLEWLSIHRWMKGIQAGGTLMSQSSQWTSYILSWIARCATIFSYDHTYLPPVSIGYFGIHSVIAQCQICWNRSGQPHVLPFVYVEALSALQRPMSSSPAEDNGARENDHTNECNNYTLQDLSSTLRFDECFPIHHPFSSPQQPSVPASPAIFISSLQRTLRNREVRTRAKTHTECHWARQLFITKSPGPSGLVSHPSKSFGRKEASSCSSWCFPFLFLHSLLPSFLLFFPVKLKTYDYGRQEKKSSL